jgi:hypothetical protein
MISGAHPDLIGRREETNRIGQGYSIKDMMKVLSLAILLGIVGCGCASSDPISRLMANPPQSNGKAKFVNAAPNAPLQEVVTPALGPGNKYTILETRPVRLADGSNCTAVLVDEKGAGHKIVLLYYAGPDRGGWWAQTYDAK